MATRALSFALVRLPGIRGRVDAVDIRLIAGTFSARGLVLARASGHGVGPVVHIDHLTVRLNWKDLLRGVVVADVTLGAPQAFVDIAALVSDRPPPRATESSRDGNEERAPWQEQIRRAFPFDVNLAISGGGVRIANLPGQDGTDVRVDDIELSLGHLANTTRLSATVLARLQCQARIMSSGRLVLHAEGYPLAEQPTFDMDATLQGLNLAELKTVIREQAGVEVKRGMFDVYVEAAAKSGTLQGYAKPIFERLEVDTSDKGVAAAVKGAGAKVATRLFREGPERRIATRVEFGGSVGHPNVDVLGALGELIRNAFLKPLGANLENRLHLSPGKQAHDASVHYVRPGKSRSRAALELIADTARRWALDEVPRMGAALSYYTAFSLAPLLILVIAIAGLAFGREAAQGRIMDEVGGLVGRQSAAAIQSMIQSAQKPTQGIVATVISLVGLFLGASGVLSELKFALNRIFRTEESGGVGELVKQRLKLLGMILGIGFLLTVSLAVSAAVSAAGKVMGGALPIPELVMQAVNFVISFAVVTALFGLMYKFVPDVRLRWRDIWIGAGLTSFLFSVGKVILGLYLGKGAVASSYGAAGSVLIILLWVYYSALIFYFGAEFTHVYAERRGVRPQPQPPRQDLSRAA